MTHAAKSTLRGPAGLLALLVLSIGVTPATLIQKMSLEELVDQAQSVVHGSVARKWSAWDDKQQLIWTHYEIVVADSLKGAREGKIVVSEPGGMVGDAVMQVAGAPVYEAGEEVVLFTASTPIGYARTCGWTQGKFRVEKSADGVRKIIALGLQGAGIADSSSKQPAARQAQTDLRSVHGMQLDEFKARLRALIQARAPGAAK
jgi:hypothetical protein